MVTPHMVVKPVTGGAAATVAGIAVAGVAAVTTRVAGTAAAILERPAGVPEQPSRYHGNANRNGLVRGDPCPNEIPFGIDLVFEGGKAHWLFSRGYE